MEPARRLSLRECARIQNFPECFEPVVVVDYKFTQIGYAVPPLRGEGRVGDCGAGAGGIGRTAQGRGVVRMGVSVAV
ncbi:DNA cytosine methyltransferase, partial [Salmonella enterica]|uniref:DNA cytosine methyltransferase n=1 Tax=Salmonella enterica TaxID=28901 RepID=UPI00223C5BB8